MQSLEKVMELSSTPTEDGIGILTSENRDTWAKAYQILIKGDAKLKALMILIWKAFIFI